MLGRRTKKAGDMTVQHVWNGKGSVGGRTSTSTDELVIKKFEKIYRYRRQTGNRVFAAESGPIRPLLEQALSLVGEPRLFRVNQRLLRLERLLDEYMNLNFSLRT